MRVHGLPGYEMMMSMTANNYDDGITELRLRILRVMEQRRISKAAMARSIGVERISLHNYLTARRDPKLEPLLMCAHQLGMELSRDEHTGKLRIEYTAASVGVPKSAHPAVIALSELMAKNDMAEIDVAQRSGIALRTIVQILNGTHSPDINVMDALLNVFDHRLGVAKAS